MSDPKTKLRDLRREKATLQLEMECDSLRKRKAVQNLRNRALTESFTSSGQDLVTVWADLLDRWRDGNQFTAPISTTADRLAGRDFPFFNTEQDLAIYRGTARILVESVSYAKGLVRGLRSFVIGTGFAYRVCPTRDETSKAFVARVQNILDEFCHRVRWANLKRETFKRSVRDGEFFEWYGLGEDGKTWVRTVEPEQVRQPPGTDWFDWSFGIKTPREDVQNVEAYWVGHMINPSEGEEVDPSCMVHFKRNTDRSIKRGLTDFCFDSYEALQIASKLRKAMGIGAAVQASIAYVREHQTADVAQATTFQQLDVDTTQTNQISGRNMDISYIEPGQRLDIPATYKYTPPPSASNAEPHVAILDAMCRAAAAAWNAPEWLVHSNAQNMGAYTSSLVAESPFVIGVKAEQDEYTWADLQGLMIVIRNAIEAGDLPENTLDYVEIKVEPPQVEHRDKLQEAQRDQVEVMGGWKSRQLCAQERGYDWEQIEKDNQDYDDKHAGGEGGAFGMPGGEIPGLDLGARPAPEEAPAEKVPAEGGDTGNANRQTVGGLNAIKDLQVSFYGGEIPRDAAIANVQLLFDFTPEEANALFPDQRPENVSDADSNAPPVAEGINPRASAMLMEAGFTGTVTDRRGRKYHYVNGRRVAAAHYEKGGHKGDHRDKGKPTAAPPAKPKAAPAAAKTAPGGPRWNGKETGNAEKGFKEPLADRMARVDAVEKGTGITFMDRVINQMLGKRFSNIPGAHNYDPAYAKATADIAKNGPNAKAESIAFMKATRDNMRKEILARNPKTPGQDIQHALQSLADGDRGKLTFPELLKRQAGTLKPSAPRKRKEQEPILPDNLRLQPLRQPKKKGTGDAYFDALDEPVKDRLDEIAFRDRIARESGRPSFARRVLMAFASDPREKASLDDATRKVSADVPAKDRQLRGLSAMLQAAPPAQQIKLDKILAAMHDQNEGTVSVGEFTKLLKDRKLEGIRWLSRGQAILEALGQQFRRALLEAI